MADGNTTSYSLDKPTYAYTARTTEFDDALIRRGIVTLEQAMMGKGASAAEAKRLAAEARESGILAMPAHCMRFWPAWVWMNC